MRLSSEGLDDSLLNSGRGLMEECGEEFDMSTSDFVDFLFSSVTELQWNAAGLTTHDARIARCEKIAQRIL